MTLWSYVISLLLLEFFNLLLPGESRSQMRGNCKDEGPVIDVLYLASFNILGLPGIVSFPELFV